MREIVFYRTENGKCPIEDFLDSLTAKQAKKVTWVMSLVESLDRVPTQYFKKLESTDDIWEIRAEVGRDAFRLLGFIHKGKFVVLTNGFSKKSQKTPIPEIELAERRKRDHIDRS